jgi:hypothetical protein
MEYVQETNEQGKIVIRKVGLSPIQRPGMEYELDLVCDLNYSHIMTVSKSRCSAVADMVVEKPGPAFMQPVIEWLQSGAPQPAPVFEPATVPVITLDQLVDKYGAEVIIAAGMPSTQEEIDALAAALEKGGV